MARKSKVAEIIEDAPTVEEQLAEVAAKSAPAGIPTEPPIIAGETKITPQVVEEEELEEELEEDETPKRVPLKERLGDVDEDELEELFKLAGVAERLEKAAKKRAEDLERAERNRIAQEEQSKKDREDQEYLRRLRKTDPVKYNQELDKREALEEAQQIEVQRIRAVTDEFTKRLATYVETHVDKSVAEKFRGKDYTNYDLIDGIIQYMDDILQAERSNMRASLEKELLPTLRKKALTEINGGEEVPQPANSGTVRGKPRTNKLDFATESEMAEALAKGMQGLPGGITREQAMDWYKRHGVPGGYHR